MPALTQSAQLKQTQKLAPQMQQGLRILQAPALELRALIQTELNENPVLEDETPEISLEDKDFAEADDFDQEFSELSQMDEEWREYMAQARKSTPRSAEQEEKRQFLLDSLVRTPTLQEFLLEQLNTEGVGQPTRDIAELLIGNLDENGMLVTPLEEISLRERVSMKDLNVAKQLVQSFDPPGVCAADVRESLLIQLRRSDKGNSPEYRLVASHLEELARHKYPQIAHQTGLTPEQVAQAAESIANLNPKPGREFGRGTNTYVTPDVDVEEDEHGDFQIRLSDEQLPRLKISNTYKDLMADQVNRKEVRTYIKDKIRSARALIHSIDQRQETIRQIAEQILVRQEGFMRKGKAELRPMTMAEVAAEVGVHETTVSRAISGKYMSTPQGVFEMRFFFTSGIQTDSGQQMASTGVKTLIEELVRGEDPRKPLSDQRIVELMAEKGIKIARRTVAKYREEMEILPSHLRKRY